MWCDRVFRIQVKHTIHKDIRTKKSIKDSWFRLGRLRIQATKSDHPSLLMQAFQDVNLSIWNGRGFFRTKHSQNTGISKNTTTGRLTNVWFEQSTWHRVVQRSHSWQQGKSESELRSAIHSSPAVNLNLDAAFKSESNQTLAQPRILYLRLLSLSKLETRAIDKSQFAIVRIRTIETWNSSACPGFHR